MVNKDNNIQNKQSLTHTKMNITYAAEMGT